MSKYKIYKEERENYGGSKSYRIYAKVFNCFSWILGDEYYLVPTYNWLDRFNYEDNILWKSYINFDINQFKENIEEYLKIIESNKIKSFKKKVIG